MKHFLTIIMILCIATLSACGGDSDGGGSFFVIQEEDPTPDPTEVEAPVANAGTDKSFYEGEIVTLDGSGSYDPKGTDVSYSWSVTPSIDITSVSSDEKPAFTAPEVVTGANKSYVFMLTVTDEEGLTAYDSCNVTILNKVELGPDSDDAQELINNVLYTAYAGIGYMSTETTSDDENLYNVMFNDLNSLGTPLVYDSLINIMDNYISYSIEILKLLQENKTATFNYDHKNAQGTVLYNATLTIKTGSIVNINDNNGLLEFKGNLSIDFKPIGYNIFDRIYKGVDGNTELKVSITGYYKIIFDISSFPPIAIDTFCITKLYNNDSPAVEPAVEIIADNSLTVVYPTEEVVYDNWIIWYDFYYLTNTDSPVPDQRFNLAFLPPITQGITLPSDGTDFRDYYLGGSFSINSMPYSFGYNFHYQQEQWDYPDPTGTLLLVFLNGTLSVPDLDGFVTIDTPDDVDQPVTSKTIARNFDGAYDGIWTSGEMTISTADDDIKVEFSDTDPAGTAFFTWPYEPDDVSWTANNWQD